MNKDSKDQKVDQTSGLEEIASHIESQTDTRRRFIKKAIVTAPVILTVSSRPVWGQSCSLSGLISGNASKPYGPCGGQGCSPGYYKKGWFPPPHPSLATNSSFNGLNFDPDLPGCELPSDVFTRDVTLIEVLEGKIPLEEVNLGGTGVCAAPEPTSTKKGGPPGDPDDACKEQVLSLARQTVAALLNAAYPLSFDLDVCQVIDLFNSAYATSDKDIISMTVDYLDFYNNQECNGEPGDSTGFDPPPPPVF